MAVLGKFDDATVTLNSVDLSAFVRSVTITTSASEEEISAMGDDWAEFTVGRKEWSGTITFWQSFYTSEVDASVNGLVGGAAVTLSVIPDTGAAAATNPDYNGNVFVLSYEPISGDFDTNLGTQLSFRGTGTLTRGTS